MESINKILEQELAVLQNDIVREVGRAGGVLAKYAQSAFVIKASGNTAYMETQPGVLGQSLAKVDNRQLLQILKDYVQSKNIEIKDDEHLERLAKFIKWRVDKFGFKSYGGTDVYASAIEKMQNRLESRLENIYTNKIEQIL